MKITIDNLQEVTKINSKISTYYLESLCIDLMELNNELENNNLYHKRLYIDIQDYHDEYSPERTDPCPDYYGMLSLRFENDNYMIGDFIERLDELDTILFTLIEFFEHR
jgi:hypothetical protein